MSKVQVYIPFDTYNVQVLRKYWNPTWAHGLMIPAGTRIHEGELWRPISGSRLGLDMVPPWKVSLRLSQSGCALVRARDAAVLWCATSATPATPTDSYSNHNSLYRGYSSLLLVIIV